MDLSLVPIDDMVDEIEKRCDAMILGLIGRRSNDIESNYGYYRGSNYSCLGLADDMRNKLLIKLKEGAIEK